jgi:hypothetical protein
MLWSGASHHPSGTALDFWLAELGAMGIKWVALFDDGQGSSVELCRRLVGAGLMPVVRLDNEIGGGNRDNGWPAETIRQLVAEGVRYFETDREPDVSSIWRGRRPPDWAARVAERFVADADRLIHLGGLPGLPGLASGNQVDLVGEVVKRKRGDLFSAGAWLAVHNYTLNRPLDYPNDAINRTGQAIGQTDYDRDGAWAWDGRPRDAVNQWRLAGKQAGTAFTSAPGCFLAYRALDGQAFNALGYHVPMITTEGGPVVGWPDDPRYPRVDPQAHAGLVAGIDAFMQGNSPIAGAPRPDCYLAFCYSALANSRLAANVAGWENRAWYTERWDTEFHLQGLLPAVQAFKQPGGTGVARPAATAEPAPARSRGRGRAGAQPSKAAARGGSPSQAAGAGQAEVRRPENGAPSSGAEPGPGFAPAPESAGAGGGPAGAAFRPPAPVTSPAGAGPGLPSAADDWQPPLLPAGAAQTGRVATSILGGKVSSADGAPAAGVRVTLTRREGTGVRAQAPQHASHETTTSGDGAFRFARLPLGVYDLSADNVTIAGLALDGVARRGIKLSLGTMRAGPARIEGRMPGGAPGRAVTLSGEAGLRQTVLDANGAFSFAGLAAGSYRLALDGIGTIRESVTVAPGGLFKLLFPLGSSISGQLLDPPPGAVAVLHAPPAWRWSRQCPFEKGSTRGAGPAGGPAIGSFAFEGLPPGCYRLEAAGQPLGQVEVTGENIVALDPVWFAGPPGAGAGVEAGEAASGPEAAPDAGFPSPGPVQEPASAPASRPAFCLAHYVLLGPLAGLPGTIASPATDAATRLTLALALDYLRRTGTTAGFCLAEAQMAAKVTIIGDQVPAAAEDVLRQAGCQVARFAGDGYTLAQALAGPPTGRS